MTYIAGETPVHRCDARVKIVVLFVFSIALLAAPNWWSVGILAAAIAVVLGVAKLPLSVMNSSLVPVYIMAAFSLFFNVLYSPGLDGVLAGLLVAVRMVALIAASFVVCFTTSSSELLQAFRWLIAPLRHLHAPHAGSLELGFHRVVRGAVPPCRQPRTCYGCTLLWRIPRAHYPSWFGLTIGKSNSRNHWFASEQTKN